MTLKLHIPDNRELKPRLVVFGVGGAGGNAINNMISRSLDGVDFVAANTDAQALSYNQAPYKIQLGEELTEGLGAGAKPDIGERAAEESIERIIDVLTGSHMCFVTAGMGGGTGTGAAPIVARAARELGILTVGVVTKPFNFEGRRRMQLAEAGIKELQQYVDTLIIIPNQNLFLIANERTSFSEAFSMADDVLYQGVKGVTDLMVHPGQVNLDFADIRSVMDEMGKAMMGTGEAEGENRAAIAAERAIDNPLLDEISLKGARGVLISITGGEDMSLFEVDEASNKIIEQVDPDANIIFGSTIDPEMNGRIRVSVVATGIDADEVASAGAPSRRNVQAEAPARDLFDRDTEAKWNAKSELKAPEPKTSEPKARMVSEPISSHTQHGPVNNSQRERISIPTSSSAQPTGHSSQYSMNVTSSAHSSYKPIDSHAEDDQDLEHEVFEPVVEKAYVHETVTSAPSRSETVLERMQAAARREPISAPKLEEVESPQHEKKRFGFEDVFRRMTGQEQTDRSPKAPETATFPTPMTRQPNANSSQKLNSEEIERVDIPAFLRRQAN